MYKRTWCAFRNFIAALFLVCLKLNATNAELNVHADARIELLYIVQRLTDHPVPFKPYSEKSGYAEEVEKTFRPFSDHIAVRLFRSMMVSGTNWSYDAPPRWILCYRASSDLEPIASLPDDIVKRAGGHDNIGKLASAFRSFIRDTKFDDFFRKHSGLYKALSRTYSKTGNVSRCYRAMVDYFGYCPNRATIIIAPLLYLGNYGYKVEMLNKNVEFFIIDSPYDYTKNKFAFDANEIKINVFHEFTHAFANDAILTCSKRNSHSDWLPMIKEKMAAERYRSWDSVLCESVARASEIYFAEKLGEADLGKKRQIELTKRGWYWVPAMADRMKQFYLKKKDYTNFSSFVPNLLSVLDELEPVTEDVVIGFEGTKPCVNE